MMAFPAATTRPTTTFSFQLTSPGKSKPQPPKLTSSSLLAKPSGIRLSCARSVDVSKEDSPTQQQQQPPQQLPEEDSGAEASAQAFDKRRMEEKFAVLNTGIYECRSCGYKYDESLGDPLYPIPPGLPFNKMPEDWRCPTCGAAKSFFKSKSVEIAGFAQNQQFGFGTNTLTSGQKAILIYGSLLLFFILFLSHRRLPHSPAFGAVEGRINSAFTCADIIQPILYNTEDQPFTTLLKLDG